MSYSSKTRVHFGTPIFCMFLMDKVFFLNFSYRNLLKHPNFYFKKYTPKFPKIYSQLSLLPQPFLIISTSAIVALTSSHHCCHHFHPATPIRHLFALISPFLSSSFPLFSSIPLFFFLFPSFSPEDNTNNKWQVCEILMAWIYLIRILIIHLI